MNHLSLPMLNKDEIIHCVTLCLLLKNSQGIGYDESDAKVNACCSVISNLSHVLKTVNCQLQVRFTWHS